jgi:uncharacterized protein HemX
MPEDIQEQASEAPQSAGPAQQRADIADEEDLDVVLERVAPKRSRGCGWVGWVVALAIVVIAGALFYRGWDKQRQMDAEQARKERQTTYMGQETGIIAKVERAAKDASAGHIDAAIDVLEAAQGQWGQLAQGAQAQGDPDVADRATERKAALADALKSLEADRTEAGKLSQQAADLEAQLKTLQAKQDEINARVRDRILQLAAQGGQATPGQAAGQPASEAPPVAN